MTAKEANMNKTIIFQLGREEFGVSVSLTQSIEKVQEITSIPQVAKFVMGVINLRGTIIPVIDLKQRLELGHMDVKDTTRILIIKINEISIGVLVDSCHEVLDIPPDIIHPATEIKSFIHQEYIRGVVSFEDRLVMLLNIEHLFINEELQKLEENVQ
ncbi:chemotaxis protein CheW [Bacillus sp. AK031]